MNNRDKVVSFVLWCASCYLSTTGLESVRDCITTGIGLTLLVWVSSIIVVQVSAYRIRIVEI
jgi:hypothetical protein